MIEKKNQPAYLALAFSIFILFQPVLDVITAFQVKNGQFYTLGTIVRALFMALCFLYTVLQATRQKKWFFLLSNLSMALYCLIFLLLCYKRGGLSCVLGNIKEMIKLFYFPFVLLAGYLFYCRAGHLVDRKILAYTGLIYMSVIFVGFVTGTGFDTYWSGGAGNKGWFHAANEIGVVIGMLSPVVVCYYSSRMAQQKRDGNRWPVLVGAVAGLGLTVFCSLFIGTKAVFLSVAGYVVCFLLWHIIEFGRYRRPENRKQALIAFSMCIAMGLLYLVSPLRENIEGRMLFFYHKQVETSSSSSVPSQSSSPPSSSDAGTDGAQSSTPSTPTPSSSGIESSRFYRTANWLLSNRLAHALPTIKTYAGSDLAGKLFGVGYMRYEGAPASMEKALEMDFLTLLLRHGILGTILYVIPLLYFLFRILKQIFVRFRKVFGSIWYCTYLYALLLGVGIAFFAGHVLTAPAVSIYIAVILILSEKEIQKWKQEDR